jgi:BirA family transcriptional regulator, biotin operon repressor / biotin---[acetyl-CoA-carboxylase] ligase
VPAAALGQPRLHLRVTDSTNDRARELALAGAPHGTLVTASEQLAGRGRQGRRWSAPPGSALLTSLVLRSECLGLDKSGGVLPQLPLIAAVAACDTIGGAAMVKWPNDIVIVRDHGTEDGLADGSAAERRASGGVGDGVDASTALAKLGGILTEGRPQEGWAVLGIGLNVAVRLEDLPEQLQASAASMNEPASAIESVLARLLEALRRRLDEPVASVLEAYRGRDALRGREVEWAGGRGRANGVDEQGRLVVVKSSDGECVALDAGEVHLALQPDGRIGSAHSPACSSASETSRSSTSSAAASNCAPFCG